ncbi:MAG: cysteine desulfurase NifS [Ruminococcaceae bacterium]|nr:cysteine desulfurase NifS [Oscillospiraceae bacterium]
MSQRFVYADNAATTPVSDSVFNAMLPFIKDQYGNPSSIYSIGREATAAIKKAREQVAALLNAKTDEIIFNGGGSEGDNTVLKGYAFANRKKGNHIISTKIEHHAMLHAMEWLEKQGFEVTLLGVDEYGRISLDELRAAIRPETILISVMAANNEIGTVQPLAEIGAIAKEHKIAFHTDAVQAVGHIPLDVEAMNITMLSMSAHKFHGPKGVGALYVKRGTRIDTFLHGGGQERSRRGGTENVAGIVGLGQAAEDARVNLEADMSRIAAMRDRMVKAILEIPYTRLNGHPTDRLPGNANFSIEGIEGEAIVLTLDNMGIAASSGSACSSGSLDPSHVLMSIGLSHAVAHGSLRLSLDSQNTEEDVDYIIQSVKTMAENLRAVSPVWEDGKPLWANFQ